MKKRREKTMCKKTTFTCDRKGCQYTIQKQKNNIPLDLNVYPKEFTKVRINKKIHHLCPDCYQTLTQKNIDFINGKQKKVKQ
jgi:hypothetical protein